jgi:DAPkinase-like Roc (Ras of Complex) protein
VQARVWDFGGQHVLHAMHEFFLTARSLYLLVLGERDDMAERDATYWLQLIRSYAGSAPVVVALNKSGGRARDMDRRTLEEKCGPILAWVPTECSELDSRKSGIKDDAERVYQVLPLRFQKYGLSINLEKTRVVRFASPQGVDHQGEAEATFDFLGHVFLTLMLC